MENQSGTNKCEHSRFSSQMNFDVSPLYRLKVIFKKLKPLKLLIVGKKRKRKEGKREAEKEREN